MINVFRPNRSTMHENNIVPIIPPKHGQLTTNAASDSDNGPDSNDVAFDVRTKKFGDAHEQLEPNATDKMLPNEKKVIFN